MTVLGPLPGGSESYVARARTVDGDDRVVKVGIPRNDLTAEAAVLAAADGRGYAVLHAHDVAANALLIELLGTSLHRLGWSPERTLGVLADTLAEAWRVPLATAAEVTAGVDDKATLLHRMVVELWERLDRPCPARVVDQALRYADRRAAGFDPDRCVVVHGDPHPGNTLRVTAPRHGRRLGLRPRRPRRLPLRPGVRPRRRRARLGRPGRRPRWAGRARGLLRASSPGAPVSRRRTSGSGATWSACRPGSTCWASEPSGSAEGSWSPRSGWSGERRRRAAGPGRALSPPAGDRPAR